MIENKKTALKTYINNTRELFVKNNNNYSSDIINNKTLKTADPYLFNKRYSNRRIKIPKDREKCGDLRSAFRRTGVKVSSVAVTLKQWWRDVGLCPRAPRATLGSLHNTKIRCRRPKPMGHALSMCKLQHCRHKKSKYYLIPS